MKRLIALVLCAACLCASAASAATAAPSIGGKAAHTVTVEMGAGVSADVVFAQGSVSKDQSAAELLRAAAARSNLLAACSGGTFNVSGAAKLDGYGNVPCCYASVVKNGALVNGGGEGVYLGFTADGRALIDVTEATLRVGFSGREIAVDGVNKYYPDKADAALLFTPEAGCDLPVPASAKAAKIVNGRVSAVLSSGKMACAPGTYYFVCGKDRLSQLPAVGASVSFATAFSDSAWSGVTTAVSCGPWLLHNGNAAPAESPYSYLSGTVSPDAVGSRTFAAVLSDGSLMLGTCTASARQLVVYLLSLHARDAMLLDGGASSLLSASGSVLTSTDRRLNHILCVYGAAPKAVLTEQKLTVNGAAKQAEIYNIDGSNYFKLRDVAALLTGTPSQFSVGYDSARNTVTVRTGSAYTPQAGDLQTGTDRSETAVVSAQRVEINGRAADLTAYNIGGNNFFKLRELGAALNFTVGYEEATRTITIHSR